MSITFSSCFYIIKSKFDPSIYIEWMTNFLSIVNHFNLVIYCDESSVKYIPQEACLNPKIKIIVKPLNQFYNYKYKYYWVENHKRNHLLNSNTSWELNMLWSEKIWFVKETIERNLFATDFYGWCDIGYFRNTKDDIHTSKLTNWCSNVTTQKLDKNKICYACINNDNGEMKYLHKIITRKNQFGLPTIPIPPTQKSISGGFFILHKDKINWWSTTYDNKLQLYFNHHYLVKDDQIILADCIFSNRNEFYIFKENSQGLDNWFMFQRILSNPPLEKVEPNPLEKVEPNPLEKVATK